MIPQAGQAHAAHRGRLLSTKSMARLTDLPSELITDIFSFLREDPLYYWDVEDLKKWSLFNKYLSPSILRALLDSCTISLDRRDKLKDFLLAPRGRGQFLDLVTKLELRLVWNGFEGAMGTLSTRNAEAFRPVPELRLELSLIADLDLPPQASMESAEVFKEWRFKSVWMHPVQSSAEFQRRVHLAPFPQISEAVFDNVALLDAFPSSLKSLVIHACTLPPNEDLLVNLPTLEKLVWQPHDIFPYLLPTTLRELHFNSHYLDPVDHLWIFQQLSTLVNLQHFGNRGLEFDVDSRRRTSLQWDEALSYLPLTLQTVHLGTHLDALQFRPTLNSISDYFAKNLPHLQRLHLALLEEEEEEKVQDMLVDHIVPQRLKVFATPLEVLVGMCVGSESHSSDTS
jgi:hypothetical protein